MTISEQLATLFGRQRFCIKPGPERINRLLAQHDHPERRFASIHIVGTNGKGSTASFLATILKQAGYQTGLFTSPHLVNYAERFKVNGADIPQRRLLQLVDTLLQDAPEDATFFELTTALAAIWFAEKGVQLAIFEAGMGGGKDATASIPAFATIVTPISLDHCRWLGNDLRSIAAEKIAIAEPGTTVISAMQQQEAEEQIRRYCQDNNNRLLIAGEHFRIDADHLGGGYSFTDAAGGIQQLTPSLAGRHQQCNSALAVALARQLESHGFPAPDQAIDKGVSQTVWPGRFEKVRLKGNRLLIMDGAHNPDGARVLARTVAELDRKGGLILLLAVMADKDLTGILEPLLPLATKVITVPLAQERGMSATELAALCLASGKGAIAAETVQGALSSALEEGDAESLILAAGSLFLVAELKAVLSDSPFEAVNG